MRNCNRMRKTQNLYICSRYSHRELKRKRKREEDGVKNVLCNARTHKTNSFAFVFIKEKKPKYEPFAFFPFVQNAHTTVLKPRIFYDC